MNIDINFPTRTMEALIQQNKTLSTKLDSISKLCDTQAAQIRELKNQNDIFYKENQKKTEEYQMLLGSYQKIQVSYQELYSSYQELKISQKQAEDNLTDTEKQFALQYTEFLEKQQNSKNKNAELKLHILRLTKYKNRIQTRVRPYLKNLKEKLIQNEREGSQQKEKISTFQKQLTNAYDHIQKISLDLKSREEGFQTDIKHLTQKLNQEEATNQHNKKYITDNKKLNQQILEVENKNSKLKADLISMDQKRSHLEKQYLTQIDKLQKQIQTLTVEKDDLFHQLKVFSKELIKKEIKQSQINTLWQKKLTTKIETLQNTLKTKNNPQITKTKKDNEIVKNYFLQQDNSKLHQIYHSLLEVQTGIFKTLP